MKVSVIIPARNEARLLPGTLDALSKQTLPADQFEVLVVDNGSTDATPEVARERGARVLEVPGVSVGALRNVGAREAQGDILAFLDADCIAHSTWLQNIVEAISTEPSVTGCECAIAEDDTWIAKAWFCLRPSARRRARCIGSANLALPRNVFEEIGGFDEELRTGEDCELCARAAAHLPVYADPSLVVVHLGTPKTLAQFLRREIWHGLGALGTVRHNLFDKPFLGTVGFVACTLVQLIGIVFWLLGRGGSVFLAGSVGVIALLAASVYYRREYLRDAEHAFALGFLYWLFYLGRSISLALAFGRGGHYHGNRGS